MSWNEQEQHLIKEFELDGFSQIVNKLPAIAEIADEMNHHPDFEVYGYKKVRFKLTTHSEGKVTDKDYQLAKQIDRILG